MYICINQLFKYINIIIAQLVCEQRSLQAISEHRSLSPFKFLNTYFNINSFCQISFQTVYDHFRVLKIHSTLKHCKSLVFFSLRRFYCRSLILIILLPNIVLRCFVDFQVQRTQVPLPFFLTLFLCLTITFPGHHPTDITRHMAA